MIRFILAAFSAAILEPFPAGKAKNEADPGQALCLDSGIPPIDFCGDQMPLSQIQVAVHYQNMVRNYDRHKIRQIAAASRKKILIVESILIRYGIPSDFKYVPLVESGMRGQATSHRGAAGYWQLMPSTARSLGLTVNRVKDERKDLAKSTHAAGKYLRELYRELGSWTLVAAAFNAGPSQIKKNVSAKTAGSHLGLGFNSAAIKYICRLIAAKEWIGNPARSLSWCSGAVVKHLKDMEDARKNAALTLTALQTNSHFLSFYLICPNSQKPPYLSPSGFALNENSHIRSPQKSASD